MEAYTEFAQVYDRFMDNVPYEQWAAYIRSLLGERQINDGLIVDLGCGTGTLTDLLANAGYDMIGIDGSIQMLEIAREKRPDLLFLNQDIRSFELYGTVRAIVSVCDCMNYILDPKDLQDVFSWVNNYLDPGGVFIFDLNTPYKYRHMLGEQTFAEDRADCSFIWENSYDEAEKINEYALTLFIRDGVGEEMSSPNGQGIYRKFKEYHYQRCYEPEEVTRLLEVAGLRVEAMYDAFTRQPPRTDSERVYIIARECRKSWDDLDEGILREDEKALELLVREHQGKETDI